MIDTTYRGVWYEGLPHICAEDLIRIFKEMKYHGGEEVVHAIAKDMMQKERIEVKKPKNERGVVPSSLVKEDNYL